MVKSFNEVMTLYLKSGNIGNKPLSRKRDGVCAEQLRQFFRGKKLSDVKHPHAIKGADVAEYREWRKAAGIKPVSVAREITVASAAIRWCNRELDWELRNPFQDRQYSRTDKKLVQPRERIATPQEVVMLLEKSEGLFRDLIIFYLSTGFRAKEALTLRAENVIGDEAYLLPEDNKAGELAVRYLPPEAQQILARQPKSEYAFSLDGEPVSYWWLRNRWRKLKKDCGIEDLRLHDLRRTCGDRLRQEHSLEVAQSQLGHKSYTTTERAYAKNKVDKARSALLGKKVVPCEQPLSPEPANLVPERGFEPPTYALRMRGQVH